MSAVTALYPHHGADCHCRPCLVRDIAREVITAVTQARTGVPAQGLFRYRDAAAWLGVSESKVREWVDRGVLPTVQCDTCVRIRTADLVAFAATWSERS